MWTYLRAANRLVPQQTDTSRALKMPTSTTSQACSNTKIHGKQRTAENFERLVAFIDVARLSSIAFSMMADASSVWLQAVKGTLPSEAKSGRDEKSYYLHICNPFQLLRIRDFGICLLLSPASLEAWQHGTNRTKLSWPGDCGGSWPAGSLWCVLETFQIDQ